MAQNEYLVDGADMTTVADAIRERSGTTAPLSFPTGMAEAVRGIQSGGDLSLGITGAQVGQIAKITAVDETGKPTKWEPVDIPSGGTDISLGLTAATVGQTIKVKAVDTDGKPTAWEAVDAPKDETWELIASGEMAETAKLEINKDKNGLPFSLKSAQILVRGDINIPQSSCMSVSARHWVSSKDYVSYPVEVFFGKENPKVNLWYVLREKTMPMLFWEIDGVNWQSADCKVLMGVHAHLVDGKVVRNKDILNHLINNVGIGAVMGTGNMAAGCKWEIWGVRA